jgi:hypothetical protein
LAVVGAAGGVAYRVRADGVAERLSTPPVAVVTAMTKDDRAKLIDETIEELQSCVDWELHDVKARPVLEAFADKLTTCEQFACRNERSNLCDECLR